MKDSVVRFCERGALGVSLALLAFTVVLTLCFGAYPIDPDYFAYVGRCLLSGRRLYADIWDCKGPVLYFVSAFGVWFHPVLGQPVLFGVFLAADLVLFHGLLRRMGGARAGLCTLLFAVLALGAGQFLVIGRQEMLVCLLVLLGLWSQGRFAFWGDVLTGACAGLVFFIKPNLISFLSVPLVQGALASRRTGEWRFFVRRSVCLFLGFFAVLLAVTACFLPDAVGDLWYGSLVWNITQRAQNGSGWLGYWSRELSSCRFWHKEGWIIPLFGALFVIGCVRAVRLRGREWTGWGVWAFLETAAAFGFPQFCRHYVIVACLPVVALAVGGVSEPLSRKDGRFVLLALAVALAMFGASGNVLFRHVSSASARDREIEEMRGMVGTGQGGVTVYGGGTTAAVMNKLGLLSGQRFLGMTYWWRTSSGDFRGAIRRDFLTSLNADREWMLSAKPIERIVSALGDRRIAAELSEYRLVYHAVRNKVYLYGRSR